MSYNDESEIEREPDAPLAFCGVVEAVYFAEGETPRCNVRLSRVRQVYKRDPNNPKKYTAYLKHFWYGATFWREKARRVHDLVEKGQYICIYGEPKINEYTNKEGEIKRSIEIDFPELDEAYGDLAGTRQEEIG